MGWSDKALQNKNELEPLLRQGQDLADLAGKEELGTRLYAARQRLINAKNA